MKYSMLLKKAFILAILASLLPFSLATHAAYKCVNKAGKTAYQSSPCAKVEEQSNVKNLSSSSSSSKKKSDSSGGPSGDWINSKNMTAKLSASGSFQMTDISGEILAGQWEKTGKNYKVSATFQGLSFPVKMKYDKESDSLFLSKPGFPNSLVKYSRK